MIDYESKFTKEIFKKMVRIHRKVRERIPEYPDYIEADSVGIRECLESRGLTHQDASYLAGFIVKEIEGEIFLENHPKAPRKWRSHAASKKKHF